MINENIYDVVIYCGQITQIAQINIQQPILQSKRSLYYHAVWCWPVITTICMVVIPMNTVMYSYWCGLYSFTIPIMSSVLLSIPITISIIMMITMYTLTIRTMVQLYRSFNVWQTFPYRVLGLFVFPFVYICTQLCIVILRMDPDSHSQDEAQSKIRIFGSILAPIQGIINAGIMYYVQRRICCCSTRICNDEKCTLCYCYTHMDSTTIPQSSERLIERQVSTSIPYTRPYNQNHHQHVEDILSDEELMLDDF